MIRILACPADRQGAGRYRLGLPIAALQRQEGDLNIYLSEGLPVRLAPGTGKVIGLADGFSGWDVVVVQRPMAYWQTYCLRDCRKLGIRTIVEIDDDVRNLHHLQPHPSFTEEWNCHWLTVACREADLVTAPTQELADRYAPHGRSVVIPNYIPRSWLDVEATRAGNVVGWTGTTVTHNGDLTVTYGGVAQAVRAVQGHFRVIGEPEHVQRDLSLATEPEHVPWCAWADYPDEVAKLDVGVAPLVDSVFNRAKSWLKPLEYAALGVPCVMSPSPSYVALNALGIGILAHDRARSWRYETQHLLTDSSYRTEMGQAARAVARTLTVEANAWRWAEAWTSQRRSALSTIAALSV